MIGEPVDIRPIVRTNHSGNLSLPLFFALLLLAAFLLFQALNARRESLVAPVTQPADMSGGAITAPPPLPLLPGFQRTFGQREDMPASAPRTPPAAPFVFQPHVGAGIGERPRPARYTPTDPLVPASYTAEPIVVPDSGSGAPVPEPAEPLTELDDRVYASRLRSPALTVPQGTVIAAVLETAIDSTQAGAVRAIVSRDVMGFDGSRILIPRGSRLYGEYQADLSSGQKRALVRWQRLTRPDAVIIRLDSPAADPLGRAGIGGKVDNHFFARFGSAILQSVLDIGVGLATRSVSDDAVVVALPGSTQQIGGSQSAAEIQPTLKVRQGTSVSVFVARDLDFSSVER